MKKVILFIMFYICLLACDDNCTTDKVRCYGDVLQICSEEQTWEPVYDCSEWEQVETEESAGFVCCTKDDTLDCWLPEECDK